MNYNIIMIINIKMLFELGWKHFYYLSKIRFGACSKFLLFLFFTFLYMYVAYKTLPTHHKSRNKFVRNTNITKKIIQKIEENGIDLYAIEEEMALRRELISSTCEKSNNLRYPDMWEFIVDAHHSLVWCKVHKAASATWVHYFNILGGYEEKFLRKTKRNPVNLLRSKFPRPTRSQLRTALRSSLSFVIVRDPLERLLSTYLSMIQPQNDKYYFKTKRRIKDMSLASNLLSGETDPTFGEFVDYVVQNNNDEYWSPTTTLCSPCLINFTVIAKMETLLEDQEYITKRAGVDDILTPARIRLHYLAHEKGRTQHLLEKYYSQLNFQQLHSLIDIYETDYEMFGYNATKYFMFIKN